MSNPQNFNAPVVAIDGPSGVGKGTITQMLASRLGWHLLDSGALYRLTALAAERQGVALDDEAALAALALALDVRFDPSVSGQPARVILSNDDVTQIIRTEACGNRASIVAALPQVRAALLQRQRDFQQMPGLVADGRDMGTVVFPAAMIKVFMTASAEVRADRRYRQLLAQGTSARIDDLLVEIRERDDRDMNRSAAPLRPAGDAVLIDTSDLSIEQVLDQVFQLVGKS